MAFTIHFHLGNGSEPAKPSPERRTTAGWWRHRYGSRSEYEAHLRRTFGELAGTHDDHLDDGMVLEADEICEEAEESAR